MPFVSVVSVIVTGCEGTSTVAPTVSLAEYNAQLAKDLAAKAEDVAAKNQPAAADNKTLTGKEDLAELIEALDSDYIAVRIEAIEQLGKSNTKQGTPEAKEIYSALLNARRIEFNDYEDGFINQALKDLGVMSVQEIKNSIDSGKVSDLSDACEAMRAMGSDFYVEFKPLLETLLTSKDSSKQWGALYVIEAIGPKAADLTDLIKPSLSNKDFQEQIIALRALAGIGPGAKAVAPIVQKLTLDGQNISVKSHALITFGHVSADQGEVSQKAAERLSNHLRAPQFMLKQRAMIGMLALGADAKPVADLVKEKMSDESGLAAHATVVYGNASGDWETAINRLVELTDDTNVGYEALQFLVEAGPKAKSATPSLLRKTLSTDESTSADSTRALGNIFAVDAEGKNRPSSDEDKKLFAEVVQRFQKMAEVEVGETSHYAERQLKRWKEAGWIEASKGSETNSSEAATAAGK